MDTATGSVIDRVETGTRTHKRLGCTYHFAHAYPTGYGFAITATGKTQEEAEGKLIARVMEAVRADLWGAPRVDKGHVTT